uniref:killer cell lectin-like receptor subfamily G member 1 isoform X2 n=1 Tax=Monopterus albus TaxID=43700 RepID=UPI0009B4C59A|nr:killer cell lectin-like receptor subfamily G member 1 isoform X2 [Monopterus albus]
MEMQEISIETEKDKGQEEATEPKLEVKTEALEEVKSSEYEKLQSASEDIYSEAYFGDAPLKTKAGKQSEGNVRLYRTGCFLLITICLVLLLVVMILGVKLQTGSTVCAETERGCSYEQCKDRFPSIQLRPEDLGCQRCSDGWLTYGRSCFYLSTYRLTWDESVNNCTSRGGSLAVITSQEVQVFLTEKETQYYWIGLRKRESTWAWVNGTVLQKSYWQEKPQSQDCGILSGKNPPEKNWITASCQSNTYFICQVMF